VSTDVERRLRASLDAYAGLAGHDTGAGLGAEPPEPAPDSSPEALPPSRSSRWAPLLVAAAVLLVLGGTWLLAGGAGQRSPVAGRGSSDTTPTAPASSAPAVPTSQAPGTLAATVPGPPGHPGSATLPPSPVVGVVYVFDLSTHCGIRGTDVGGVWFAARPPAVEEGATPPPGWGNPEQRGTLTLTSGVTAVVRDDAGHVVQLVAAPHERPDPCD
jgi:hypothetical protein